MGSNSVKASKMKGEHEFNPDINNFFVRLEGYIFFRVGLNCCKVHPILKGNRATISLLQCMTPETQDVN